MGLLLSKMGKKVNPMHLPNSLKLNKWIEEVNIFNKISIIGAGNGGKDLAAHLGLFHLKKPPSLKVVMAKGFYHKSRYIC